MVYQEPGWFISGAEFGISGMGMVYMQVFLYKGPVRVCQGLGKAYLGLGMVYPGTGRVCKGPGSVFHRLGRYIIVPGYTKMGMVYQC